ncbi:MAG: ABC transporter ATP-binding protein [Desulfosalsimonas sp.]
MKDTETTVENKAPLLEINGVEKYFGGVRALADISFDLEQESITGIIGPNGAGKTTLFNLITGIIPADKGEIKFGGLPVAGTEVHDLVKMGIARTFQNVELFGSMTVEENILIGLHTRTSSGMLASVLRPPATMREERQALARAMELLEFVGLQDYANRKCGDLPFGWQRLLELARAMAAEPRLLLLDEPAAGLNISETAELGKLISRIRQHGVTILLVEHDMNLTMSVCEKIVVLDRGKKIAEGPPRAVQSDEAVMEAYLGKPKKPKTV